jgi:hypothetical protein
MSEIDALKSKRLVSVCIPTHDGKICWETMFQLREEELLFRELGLPWRLEPLVIAGCSLISRARSEAVESALDRGAEAIMWIDADMNWTSGAVARLLAMDVDVVGAACPRKAAGPIDWNVSWLGDAPPKERNTKGLVEVKTIGTGFLLVKRRAFDIIKDRWPENGENVYRQPGSDKLCYAYYSAPGSWGEDTYFCHQWRQCGGKLWADPEIAIQHVIAPSWSVKARLADWLAEYEAQQREAA